MTKIFVQAEVPDDLDQVWLQHLRDFDAAHPGCHFIILSETEAEGAIEELRAKFASISPSFPFVEVFKRGQ